MLWARPWLLGHPEQGLVTGTLPAEDREEEARDAHTLRQGCLICNRGGQEVGL